MSEGESTFGKGDEGGDSEYYDGASADKLVEWMGRCFKGFDVSLNKFRTS